MLALKELALHIQSMPVFTITICMYCTQQSLRGVCDIVKKCNTFFRSIMFFSQFLCCSAQNIFMSVSMTFNLFDLN